LVLALSLLVHAAVEGSDYPAADATQHVASEVAAGEITLDHRPDLNIADTPAVFAVARAERL
jgi:hypothetical protein